MRLVLSGSVDGILLKSRQQAKGLGAIGACAITLSFLGCSSTESSGAPASGGKSTVGGAISSGGSPVSTGGVGASSGGAPASGGANASGGSVFAESGGAPAAGGNSPSGGVNSNGGRDSTGGGTGTGGSVSSSGGSKATGGAGPTGGSKATGGAGPTGGTGAVGGSFAAGGASATGGSTGTVVGPCDIYGTCVAAHSTVRALYGAYSGNLYQVKRRSDNTTKEIPVLSPGGFADAGQQDTFCAGTTCDISIIYDQSPKKNHLTPAPGGGAVKTADKPVVADKTKLEVGGHTVYGAYFEGGMGYRNNKTSGVAVADQPESMYMVTSGTHYNSLCCFDYGNAETTNNDDGNGTMEAIYFGNQRTYWGWGNMTPAADGHLGPWVEADLENGLFAGPVFGQYTANTAVNFSYVTAMIKGKPGGFAIKAGNANSGNLKTMYEGGRPNMSGYNPMKKQGAIILGIGGDNSNGSQGTFYEGCMTSDYSTDAVDEAVQANIIAAGYGR